MGKRLNINPGDKFGEWTVIKEVIKGNRRHFLCECSCEEKTKREVALYSLTMSHSKSCGCLNIKALRNRAIMIAGSLGDIYGRVTIVDILDTEPGKPRRVLGRCSCNGNIKEYSLARLKSGDTSSCGCYQIEQATKFNTLQVKDYQEKYQLFCKVEEIRDRTDGPGIEVRCKHSDCRKWFKPTKNQLRGRINSIEKFDEKSPGVEMNFYCSDACKYSCDTYRAQITPKSLRNVKTQSRCNQKSNKKSLLGLQIDECGYNYCEKCGKEFDSSDLIIHHNIMVGKDHDMADDMSHQILVCKEHHEHKGC